MRDPQFFRASLFFAAFTGRISILNYCSPSCAQRLSHAKMTMMDYLYTVRFL
jgi:hypothetical protein